MIQQNCESRSERRTRRRAQGGKSLRRHRLSRLIHRDYENYREGSKQPNFETADNRSRIWSPCSSRKINICTDSAGVPSEERFFTCATTTTAIRKVADNFRRHKLINQNQINE